MANVNIKPGDSRVADGAREKGKSGREGEKQKKIEACMYIYRGKKRERKRRAYSAKLLRVTYLANEA